MDLSSSCLLISVLHPSGSTGPSALAQVVGSRSLGTCFKKSLRVLGIYHLRVQFFNSWLCGGPHLSEPLHQAIQVPDANGHPGLFDPVPRFLVYVAGHGERILACPSCSQVPSSSDCATGQDLPSFHSPPVQSEHHATGLHQDDKTRNTGPVPPGTQGTYICQ